MRRVFTVSITIFMVLALGLIVLFDKDISDTLKIITIKQDYQRLMTDNEYLSITLYLSSDDSFVSDMDNIDSLYLKDEWNEMEVGIQEIRALGYKEVYQSTEYSAFVLDISFDKVIVTDFIFNLENGFLVIDYLNGEELSLEIGDISLNFTEYSNPTYMDVYRMFALYEETEFEYITGVVLGLNNVTGMELSISNIDIGNESITLDIDHAVLLADVPDYDASIDDLLQYDYNSMGEEESTDSVEIEQDTLIFIPFKYSSEIIRINRFPLLIDFTYLGNSYCYYVDDFQFHSQILGLEANSGRIREFIYHY